MRFFSKTKLIVLLLILVVQFIFIAPQKAYAATTPALGNASNFGILSSTYTNTAIGTTIVGDIGYTTGPAVAPTVSGTTYTALTSKYSLGGTDQATTLAALNSQVCTFTFAPGAIDLSLDTTHGAQNIYVPGVYCITGAASIGTGGSGGITLTGGGTYIFRMTGALTTVAGSVVSFASGASTCDLFWTPGAATTLGANTTFAGTDIDAAGITIGSTVSWTGRALAFGGTVSTDVDNISVPACSGSSNTAGGSTSTSSGSSSGGSSSSTQGTKSCPVLNYITPIILNSKRINADSVFLSWGPYSGTNSFIVQYGLSNGNWTYSTNVTGFSTTINALPANQPIWIRIAATDGCSVGMYGTAILAGGPSLPNTGIESSNKNNSWNLYILVGLAILASVSLVIVLRKRIH